MEITTGKAAAQHTATQHAEARRATARQQATDILRDLHNDRPSTPVGSWDVEVVETDTLGLTIEARLFADGRPAGTVRREPGALYFHAVAGRRHVATSMSRSLAVAALVDVEAERLLAQARREVIAEIMPTDAAREAVKAAELRRHLEAAEVAMDHAVAAAKAGGDRGDVRVSSDLLTLWRSVKSALDQHS